MYFERFPFERTAVIEDIGIEPIIPVFVWVGSIVIGSRLDGLAAYGSVFIDVVLCGNIGGKSAVARGRSGFPVELMPEFGIEVAVVAVLYLPYRFLAVFGQEYVVVSICYAVLCRLRYLHQFIPVERHERVVRFCGKRVHAVGAVIGKSEIRFRPVLKFDARSPEIGFCFEHIGRTFRSTSRIAFGDICVEQSGCLTRFGNDEIDGFLIGGAREFAAIGKRVVRLGQNYGSAVHAQQQVVVISSEKMSFSQYPLFMCTFGYLVGVLE